VLGALIGVIALGAIAAGVIYYQHAERKRLDAMDYDALAAELDALTVMSKPIAALEPLAVPATAPADYAAALATARQTWEKYVALPRRSSPLPSKRPWPGQFANADALAKDALDHYGVVLFYLDQRSKITSQKPGAKVTVDTDIGNVAELGNDPLHQLQALISDMQSQRNAREWNYSPAVRRSTPTP
jgi:hypothetical protein